MQLIFRKFPAGQPPAPGPGEIYVRPDSARVAEGQGLASAVCEYGTAALVCGDGPIKHLVVDVAFTHPTLDDMLAAAFAQRLLEGKTLPPGCRAFADYAAVVRQGLRPSDIAPEDSLEGIFLAIRNASGKDADLTDPKVGDRFRKDWARMVDCVLRAAEQGVNPLTTSPFAGRSAFMQERAFLVRDREVYRQDVLRGERWRVRLPDGPPHASALVLRKPTSLFFPYWSRTDRDAPAGSAYLLLVVDWGEGVWVISTDPAQRLPIPSLAVALQGKEAARNPEGAARDPWYDGRRPEHGGTLVAAPRGGTKLTDRDVLPTIKKWAHARRVRPSWPLREMAAVLTGFVALLLILPIYYKLFHKSDANPDAMGVAQNGQVMPASSVHYLPDVQNAQTGSRRGEGVEIEVHALHPRATDTFTIPVPAFTGDYNVKHSVSVKLLLRSAKPLAVSHVTVQINDQPEQTVAHHFKNSDHTEMVTDPVAGDFEPTADGPAAKKNTVRVGIQSASDEEQTVEVKAYWPPNKTLYVLAVGVSTYPKLGGLDDLPNAAHDATDLKSAFEKQQGGVFHKVVAQDLTNQSATKEAILNKVEELQQKATVYDQVVVTLSGHGGIGKEGYWFFAPCDFDRRNARDTAVFWTRGLDLLSNFKCDVFLLVDTCHSGAMTKEVVKNSFDVRRQGLVVFAACLSGQKVPDDFGGHAALTLAVLEALQGEYLYPQRGPTIRTKPGERPPPELPSQRKEVTDRITLFELQNYVEPRVEQLVGSDQAVVVLYPPDFSLRKIAIANKPK